MDFRNTIIPVAATPALQAVLNACGLLRLKPLPQWEWSDDFLFPITYLIAIGASAIALLMPLKSNRNKMIAIGLGILFLIGSVLGYTWVSNSPPRQSILWLYDSVAYGSFFATYICFGFLVALATRQFTQKRIGQDKKDKE